MCPNGEVGSCDEHLLTSQIGIGAQVVPCHFVKAGYATDAWCTSCTCQLVAMTLNFTVLCKASFNKM